MISFIIGVVALILGYLVYGKIVEKLFVINPAAKTPAELINDGVDFVEIPTWRAVLIQFLNIAGTGPIYGAIAGALWGAGRLRLDSPRLYLCRSRSRLSFRYALLA